MLDEQQIRDRLEKFLTAAETWNTEGYAAFFTKGAVKIDPNGTEPVCGRDAILERFITKRKNKLQSWKIHRDDIFVSGRGAALKWTVELKDKEGASAAYEGIDLFEFSETGECFKMVTFPRQKPRAH